MKISCIQMDMRLGEVDYNYAHAQAMIRMLPLHGLPDHRLGVGVVVVHLA